MVQRPNAVGLILCQLVIVEEQTRNVTLVNSFNRWEVEEFPSPPKEFAAYTILTDGLGEMAPSRVVSRLDTLEDVYTNSWRITMTDPVRQHRLSFRIRSCSFPVAGKYQVTLEADGELITQCVFQVALRRS